MWVDIDKIKVWMGMHDFLLICSRVMVLDWFWLFVFFAHLAFLQHEKCCSEAIVRYSLKVLVYAQAFIYFLLCMWVKKAWTRLDAHLGNKHQNFIASLNNVVWLCCMLKCFRSLLAEQCRFRSDCSCRIWAYTVQINTYISQ